jgi:hypothetical protein
MVRRCGLLSFGLGYGPLVDFGECGNEPLGSVEGREFPD